MQDCTVSNLWKLFQINELTKPQSSSGYPWGLLHGVRRAIWSLLLSLGTTHRRIIIGRVSETRFSNRRRAVFIFSLYRSWDKNLEPFLWQLRLFWRGFSLQILPAFLFTLFMLVPLNISAWVYSWLAQVLRHLDEAENALILRCFNNIVNSYSHRCCWCSMRR